MNDFLTLKKCPFCSSDFAYNYIEAPIDGFWYNCYKEIDNHWFSACYFDKEHLTFCCHIENIIVKLFNTHYTYDDDDVKNIKIEFVFFVNDVVVNKKIINNFPTKDEFKSLIIECIDYIGEIRKLSIFA